MGKWICTFELSSDYDGNWHAKTFGEYLNKLLSTDPEAVADRDAIRKVRLYKLEEGA
jgi:hypothetical protein